MSEVLGANGQPGASLIKEVSIESFEADVLEASMTVPVIVDFWADWCGPCKQLAPLLERAVKAANGKVRLAKIDIDKNQMLASQLRIQSVPTVYAFHRGRPVDGFQGALPESEVTAFIDRLLKLAPADGGDDLGAHLDAAEARFNDGDAAGAAEVYGHILQADEGNMRALAGLARCHAALKDFDQARAIVEMIPEDKRKDPALTSVLAALALASSETEAGDSAALAQKVAANPNDLQARFDLADAEIAAGKMEAALDQLLDIIARDRAWNEDAARKKLLTVFDALGGAHPLTIKGRRRLSSILFS